MLKMEKVDINFRMLQMDQLVVEYLAYRGLNSTIRSFETETANDKVKIPRVGVYPFYRSAVNFFC